MSYPFDASDHKRVTKTVQEQLLRTSKHMIERLVLLFSRRVGRVV
jgi:hypothetical protein